MIQINFMAVFSETKSFPFSTHIWEIKNALDKQEVLLNAKC